MYDSNEIHVFEKHTNKLLLVLSNNTRLPGNKHKIKCKPKIDKLVSSHINYLEYNFQLRDRHK